jgi:hypothetical protein
MRGCAKRGGKGGASQILKNKPKINEDPKDAMFREFQARWAFFY